MRQKDDKTVFAMSRRRRTGLIALCLLVLLFLAWFDNCLARRRRLSTSITGGQVDVHDHADYHGRNFIVTNIVDGDTFDVKVPDGRREHTRIRLLGIDTPETGDKDSEAMHFATEAVEFTRRAALGKYVTVYLDSPGPTRGKYGRLLAYVKLPDGRFLNEALLAGGYAYADLRFSHSLFSKYSQLSETARRHKKGLWQKATREQLPEWLQSRKTDLMADN